MLFYNKLFGQRFTPLDKALGEPLTVTDLQRSGEMIVAVSFRLEKVTTLMRWGWRRFRNYEVLWFWPLNPGTLVPPNNWNAYGTNWQAYRVDLPDDISDIAIRRRETPDDLYDGRIY